MVKATTSPSALTENVRIISSVILCLVDIANLSGSLKPGKSPDAEGIEI